MSRPESGHQTPCRPLRLHYELGATENRWLCQFLWSSARLGIGIRVAGNGRAENVQIVVVVRLPDTSIDQQADLEAYQCERHVWDVIKTNIDSSNLFGEYLDGGAQEYARRLRVGASGR
ncbi:12798_t:CDS:2 [Acaulospora colombiana]|uniref:12798_t:CDS:1 n=1 Tax=Acaulospora colombiana TaxID=27376 RepID=A0ACA9N6S2_9GLOM|nr:12798_t:CDS:2 [Acaulospora colombiana]